jgi:hypothetical protein
MLDAVISESHQILCCVHCVCQNMDRLSIRVVAIYELKFYILNVPVEF